MAKERDINIFTAYVKLIFVLVNGLARLVITAFMLVPRIVSKALTLLMKVGVIYKLLIDPMLRSIGSFFAGLWRGWQERRASTRQRNSDGANQNFHR